MSNPLFSVVVPSHDRPLRLRWLLNALADQTLDGSLWEVCVCHDSVGPETDELLRTHPLGDTGTLRFTRLPAGTAPPGANRNAALTLARAPTIVFTDDDCRPPIDWLESVRAAVAKHPGAIIQGRVEGDPREHSMRHSTFPRSQYFATVPRPWAECCNIVYPRDVIDRVGGFAENVYTGEDTDLNIRARAVGAVYVGDEQMLTYHCIEEGNLLDALRKAWRWHDLPLLVKRHPEHRSALPMGVFMYPAHAWLLPALAGVALVHRNIMFGALVVPWAVQWDNRHPGVRGRLRHLCELPGHFAINAVEMGALARGSVRYRTIML